MEMDQRREFFVEKTVSLKIFMSRAEDRKYRDENCEGWQWNIVSAAGSCNNLNLNDNIYDYIS
jgi:hypothetical protein